MREIVRTEQAPAAVGPYSQAVVAAGCVWVSGQIPLDPATGRLVEGGIEVQVARALDNVAAVLRAAGSDLRRVVRATLWLTDLDDFEAANAVWSRYFAEEPPARVTVEVSRLPRGARVEVDAVALS